jgi:RNA polymerase sigma-70 factor (ECF subfamily)
MTEERLIVEPWPVERSVGREVDWDALYADALPRVYNFFRYRVKDGADAEDLTSITFEKAWRARHRYRRDQAAFQAWLLTIARNVAVDHLRRARPHESLDSAAAGEALAAGPDPAQVAEDRAAFERLHLLLAELPARERELVALKYGAGLTNRAIARMTGLGESNVGTILHRTVLDLRARWPEGER